MLLCFTFSFILLKTFFKNTVTLFLFPVGLFHDPFNAIFITEVSLAASLKQVQQMLSNLAC